MKKIIVIDRTEEVMRTYSEIVGEKISIFEDENIYVIRVDKYPNRNIEEDGDEFSIPKNSAEVICKAILEDIEEKSKKVN
jgi:hypothetical protein